MISEPGIFSITVEAIIIKGRKVLITQRSLSRSHAPGQWEILTGRVNKGETLEEAVVREVKEEVDIVVKPIRPINTFHFYRGIEKVEHQGVSFLCEYISGNVQVDNEEQIAYKWSTYKEANNLITDHSILNSLNKIKTLID